MRHQVGIIGLVIGLIAVGIAIFQNDLRAATEPEPAPEEKRSLAEISKEAAKKLIKEKVLKEKAPPPPPDPVSDLYKPHDSVQLSYMGLGFLAMVLGVFSWVKKDHVRISSGAVAVGLVAVAWQYVLIGVIIAVILILAGNLG